MLVQHARHFVREASDYIFEAYLDAPGYYNYVYPGDMDLDRLGRFRAGHRNCPGDVAGKTLSDEVMALLGEESESELTVEPEHDGETPEAIRMGPRFGMPGTPRPARSPSPPPPSVFERGCWTAVEIVLYLVVVLTVVHYTITLSLVFLEAGVNVVKAVWHVSHYIMHKLVCDDMSVVV